MDANRLPVDVPGLESEFQRVEVRRSSRRRKTVSAQIVGEALIVSLPERLSRAEEHQWVQLMTSRMSERRRRDRLNSDDLLARRAAELADRYLDGIRPTSVEWVSNQRSRSGLMLTRRRLGPRFAVALAEFPAWVRDYVLVHELAQSISADHSEPFWRLVNRYPLTEHARGFLMAKGLDEANEEG